MPLPNFFQSYFYGRSGNRDFTIADLPANRIQLFRDVLSVRRGNMVALNLLYLLFWLPAAFWTFVNLMQFFSAPDGEGLQIGTLAMSYFLGLFPLTAITGPFNLGVSFVLRTWARDEHSFMGSDFRSAVKQNWKHGLMLGAISGAFPLLLCICLRFYLGMVALSFMYYLPLAIAALVFLLWSLCAPLMPMMIVTYDLPFAAHLKNALLLTLAELPRALLIRLATLIIPILLLIIALLSPSALGIASGAALLAYALFMPAFNKLLDASFANYLCEKYLNPRIEGARTDIGLRPKEVE